jgi:RNA polymerase sigma factor (sigma-70 family)
VTELHPVIYDLVPSVANTIHRRYKAYVEKDDVKQELVAWAMTRAEDHIVDLMEPVEERRRHNEQRIAWQMRRVAERYARKEKAAKSGYRTGDEAFYDTAMIAQVLPHVIASIVDDTVLEQAQNLINDGSPKKPSVPAEGGNLLATLIDVKRSYLKLEVEDQTILRMRYHEGLTLQQVAGLLECAVSTADRRCTSALRKVQNGLGGDNPWQ